MCPYAGSHRFGVEVFLKKKKVNAIVERIQNSAPTFN